MIVCKTKYDLQRHLNPLIKEGKQIGFVPTMGALHEGHLSLIKASRGQDDLTVCSIFVNPTQFNDAADFQKYPVTIETDILQLADAGTGILFLPSVQEMYPQGTKQLPHYDLGDLETVGEGRHRPGHFQGVCQVVHRLFEIVMPQRAYFGQKDYQQCLVIKKLVQLANLPVHIQVHPTVRESSGLAMSSRNMRLSDEEKQKAAALYAALTYMKDHHTTISFSKLEAHARERLAEAGFAPVEYINFADSQTLQPLSENENWRSKVIVAAAFLNNVRLIDNVMV